MLINHAEFAKCAIVPAESRGRSPDLVGIINVTVEDFTESLTLFKGESVVNLWPQGLPTDGRPIIEINYPLLPVVIVSYIYAATVIICALLCLIFTAMFRKRK
jgi:hypothetical protein